MYINKKEIYIASRCLPMYLINKSHSPMLFSPLYHIDSGLLPSCNNLDVDQEPAGPQVYLMSMSLTTEPPNDGPTVTEGLIYHYFLT